jgi:hypothetical protein
MFFLNNKKVKKEESVSLEVEDTKQFYQEIEILKMNISTVKGQDRIDCLNNLGELYKKTKDIEKSIYYYELSLQEEPVLGKACTDLMSLYNIKRREAAVEKNDEKIQFYLNKIDDLMKTSKMLMRQV